MTFKLATVSHDLVKYLHTCVCNLLDSWLCCQIFYTSFLLEKGRSDSQMSLLTRKKIEKTAVRCPECGRPMSKLCVDSRFWNCERCNRDFEQSRFLSRF